jgi:hypothetical protein
MTSLSSFVPIPIPVAISDIPSLDFSINISSGFPSSTPSALPTGVEVTACNLIFSPEIKLYDVPIRTSQDVTRLNP